jgi:hypothetical protein
MNRHDGNPHRAIVAAMTAARPLPVAIGLEGLSGLLSESPALPISPALTDDGLAIAPMTWAERLRRVFQIDITTCPDCSGRLRWIAGRRLRMSLNPR